MNLVNDEAMKTRSTRCINWRLCWPIGLLWLSVSCQTQPPLVLAPVGPPSAGSVPSNLDLVGTGFLRVYSATETRHGKSSKFHPHTPYLIYSTNGTILKWVRNATVDSDESPAVVRLPAGLYSIRAEDDDYGRVTVPVVIPQCADHHGLFGIMGPSTRRSAGPEQKRAIAGWPRRWLAGPRTAPVM